MGRELVLQLAAEGCSVATCDIDAAGVSETAGRAQAGSRITTHVCDVSAEDEVLRFRDPTHPYLHPEDVDIALDVNRYDFAVRVEIEEGHPVAWMEHPA